MRKKVDSRIRTLVENGVKLRQRSVFVIIGDKGRDQVVNLHYMLSKTAVKARPSVLWCYKKDLHLSSHRKKRVKQIKKLAQRGLLDAEQEDPFSLFVSSTSIRYCYYHDTQNILGNTFGMCVLQDFEALTPNLLARTIETVEGGGIIVLLLSNLNSLTQLYNLTMDVHGRLRTDSHQDVVGRFNERMVLSMAGCANILLVDDELNILPTSSVTKAIEAVEVGEDGVAVGSTAAAASKELRALGESLSDTQPAGSLVNRCRTLDQARALVTFLDAASEKTLRSTVALTASRGRGKSAALGLSIAGALALGYSNIFVTAPSPENLRTLFEFVFKGLDALEYKEHIDYDLVESSNPAWGKAVVRINVFRNHRQTVQYIQPGDSAKLAQAELLVIDEAAAIPLPTVKSLLGPYLVFLCSTVNGYEGTGRSLSLKLIQQLREQGAKLGAGDAGAGTARTFREVQLQEPIRYAPGDPIEAWLHELLCLDAGNRVPRAPAKLPHPGDCQLYYVERDTLFSYHKASEMFLQGMVSLYVASHYKNTPNDLILMSDAPAHHLFVLLAPVDESQNQLPDILAVVQVALEGRISAQVAANSLARGDLGQGDLIPWTIGQQFQDAEFPRLSGARVVRIAVHPELGRAGYGTRAVELLQRYYEGQLSSLDEDEQPAAHKQQGSRQQQRTAAAAPGESQLLTEQVKPRTGLPPLLVNLAERPPEPLHYLGVSYGLTQQLYGFWRRAGFQPVYLRQSASEVTGEHTVVMLRPLNAPGLEVQGDWAAPFVSDFKLRFSNLLPGAFRSMAPVMALSILDPQLGYSEAETNKGIQEGTTVVRGDGSPLSGHDLKRLQAYSNNLVDYHLILDLLPPLARTYFAGRLPASMSYSQAAILLCLGLQQRELTDIEQVLQLPSNQVLALFNKAVRKLHQHLRAAKEASIARALPTVREVALTSAAGAAVGGLEEELDEAAAAARQQMQKRLRPEELQQYAIKGSVDDFKAAAGSRGPAAGAMVSVKSDRQPEQQEEDKEEGRKGKQQHSGKKKHGGGQHGGKPHKKHKSG